MTLKNTGNVMAEYSFVPKNDETEVSKSWLKFNPMDGILAPEETVEVEVLVILNLEEAYEVATLNNNVREIVCLYSVCSVCMYILYIMYEVATLNNNVREIVCLYCVYIVYVCIYCM